MIDPEDIHEFAEEFLKNSRIFREKFCNSLSIQFGKNVVTIAIDESTKIADLIIKSFFSSHLTESIAEIEIWNSSYGDKLPDLHWMRKMPRANFEVEGSESNRYRVAIDNDQGFIYVYDKYARKGSIWIREINKLHLGSFITPFRVMFAWIANSVGGEVIHGSSILYKGKGLLLNGPSGSGKSTVALVAIGSGAKIIADDAVLVIEDQMYSLYTRAKIKDRKFQSAFPLNAHLNESEFESEKGIVQIEKMPEAFIPHAKMDALIFPLLADMNAYQKIDNRVALHLLAPNSLAEILGGNHQNYFNLLRLVKTFPSFRLALSRDPNYSIRQLDEIVEVLNNG